MKNNSSGLRMNFKYLEAVKNNETSKKVAVLNAN
jgi:hypothetical protein